MVEGLIAKYGKYDPVVEYLVKPKDHWMAIPGTDPTANLTCCGGGGTGVPGQLGVMVELRPCATTR